MTGFYVSLRARHPFQDLNNLLTPLGVSPYRCWKAGDRRTTPQGVQLDGIYDSSYFCCDLPLQQSDDLAEWLGRAVDFLLPIANRLQLFIDEGGSLSFYIGLEKGAFGGTVLSPKLLGDLSALRIFVEIDRYL